jgi:hypothetical protein
MRHLQSLSIRITELVDRYETAQKMYDTMTRHFRHVFRGTLSPFDDDWKMEDHAAALGNDEELIKGLEEFKLAEEHHCRSKLVITHRC